MTSIIISIERINVRSAGYDYAIRYAFCNNLNVGGYEIFVVMPRTFLSGYMLPVYSVIFYTG